MKAIAGMALLALVACDRSASRDAGAATDNPAAADSFWLMGPAPAEDLIRRDASESSLRFELGAANVSADSIELGEGERAFGTVLFPSDSTKRLEIVWSDTAARQRPSVVYVRRASRWRIFPGAAIGTDLRTVERLNGKPFVLLGFGWDYGGTVASYERGRLDSLWTPPTGRVVLARLGPNSPRDNPVYNDVTGERPFPSSSPAMQSLNPRIYEILFFPR